MHVSKLNFQSAHFDCTTKLAFRKSVHYTTLHWRNQTASHHTAVCSKSGGVGKDESRANWQNQGNIGT